MQHFIGLVPRLVEDIVDMRETIERVLAVKKKAAKKVAVSPRK
jgi:hypothetical protein